MKVHELIDILQDLNPEHEVIMARDGEGNSFSPCSAFAAVQYVPESTWSGEVRSAQNNECDEEDHNAVVLWPTN